MKHEIDTGDIILQRTEPIHPHDNAGTLHDRLKHLGAEAILDTVKSIESDSYTLTQQIYDENYKKAPKIKKNDCKINWEWPAERIHNFVRGLAPYPAAFCMLNGAICKILETSYDNTQTNDDKSFHTDGKTFLKVPTAHGCIYILKLLLEGKKMMTIKEYLAGHKPQSIQ